MGGGSKCIYTEHDSMKRDPKANMRAGENKRKVTWLRTKQPSRKVTILKHCESMFVSISSTRKS